MLNSLIFALSSAAGSANEFDFNPMNFVENLQYMGVGMLGIFIVIGIIVAITFLLNFFFKPRNKKTK